MARPSIHIHNYVHLCVEYRLLEKLHGSNSNPIEYFDVFYCAEDPTHKRWVSRGVFGDTYERWANVTPFSGKLEGDE